MFLFDMFAANASGMKQIGTVLKALRKDRGMTQQQMADLVHMHRSNYSKVESGERELSLESIDTIARVFGMTIDELVHAGGPAPREVNIEDKGLLEQVKLIQELDQEERAVVFKMIDTFLMQKRFKDFFEQHMARG